MTTTTSGELTAPAGVGGPYPRVHVPARSLAGDGGLGPPARGELAGAHRDIILANCRMWSFCEASASRIVVPV